MCLVGPGRLFSNCVLVGIEARAQLVPFLARRTHLAVLAFLGQSRFVRQVRMKMRDHQATDLA
jgi:hypothetical protein